MTPSRGRSDRVVMTDVDGVLNDEAGHRSGADLPLSSEALANLRDLVGRSGARVVVTSTWRTSPESMARLRAAGVLDDAHGDPTTPDLVSVLPSGLMLSMGTRGDEIDLWLDRHPEVRSWVVLDDAGEGFGRHASRLVRTRMETGLTRSDVDAALAILEKARGS